jgi:hypothetical protein
MRSRGEYGHSLDAMSRFSIPGFLLEKNDTFEKRSSHDHAV